MDDMKKVLVVDDDRDLLEMVEMALTEQGFEVSTLEEGRSFFTEIKKFAPDVILLDVFLNDADGRELCYQLKSDASLKDIPVALYSAGHMSNSTIVDSKANLYITKPFDIMHLAEKLRGMMAIQSTAKNAAYLDLILQYIPRYGSTTIRLLRG
jgi:DNA-binding response OmpR family regulator